MGLPDVVARMLQCVIDQAEVAQSLVAIDAVEFEVLFLVAVPTAPVFNCLRSRHFIVVQGRCDPLGCGGHVDFSRATLVQMKIDPVSWLQSGLIEDEVVLSVGVYWTLLFV